MYPDPLNVQLLGMYTCIHYCLTTIDGCVYAIKKSLKPVAGSADE